MRRIASVLGACLAASPGMAEDLCRAEVNSTELAIDRDRLDPVPQSGLRERLGAWPVRGLDRLGGRTPACDSLTLIAFLSAEIPDSEIAGYCLLPDDRLGFLLVPGQRNYRGRCTATTCDRVNAARTGAVAVAGLATDVATGRDADSGQSRLGAVMHASGAAILSGSAASLASGLGTAASGGVAAALAAPAMAGAAAVSVVAVGGAVYFCKGS